LKRFNSVATPGFFNAGSSTATRSGVFPHVGAVGIGAEYAIAQKFMVKVEYLYDFINARPVVFSPVAGSSIQFNTRTMYHIVRVGLNYHFDWLSPLAYSRKNTKSPGQRPRKPAHATRLVRPAKRP